MKVVLDTNIFISAAIAPSGPTGEVLELWRQGRFTVILSDATLREMEGVFQRPKIIRAVRRPPSWISDLLKDLRQFATFVEPVPVDAVPKDPPDNLVIGTALAGGCDYLVSGNGHLLDLGSFQGIPILTPHQFLLVLRQGAGGMRQPESDQPPIDLQALFAEPILACEALSPGYADHANDVFAVRTADRQVIVRLPRTEYAASDPFWWGCFELFGIRLGSVDQLAAVNTALSCATTLAVPHVEHAGRSGSRPYVILTHLSGEQIHDFRHQPPALLEQLGRELAAIHEARFPEFGTVTDERRDDLADFPQRLATTLERLANRFYRDAPDIQAALPGFTAAAWRLPAPAAASLVMIDLDSSQFLAQDGRLTALIDTEAYALGPRELEFVGLELVVDAAAATAIARGYQSRLPLPELAIVRPVYRFLYRLLEVQGAIPLTELLAMPAYF